MPRLIALCARASYFRTHTYTRERACGHMATAISRCSIFQARARVRRYTCREGIFFAAMRGSKCFGFSNGFLGRGVYISLFLESGDGMGLRAARECEVDFSLFLFLFFARKVDLRAAGLAGRLFRFLWADWVGGESGIQNS